MRSVSRLAVIMLATGLIAGPVVGQKPDNQIQPRSLEYLKQGEAHLAAGKLIEADDAFETALALDPRNRAAFVAMARVAQKQKLFGQAIRYSRKALALEPNDRDALAVQGEAMVELGAIAKAKENLARLQKVCASGCPQIAQLSSAISRGPTVAAATIPDSPSKN